MQFHQEMRADGEVHRLGHMRDLEPGRDAADAAHIHLHDGTGAGLHVIGELAGGIEAFAHGDRHAGVFGQPRMAGQIVGGHRLLEPGDADLGQHPGAQKCLVIVEGLIGIDHQAEIVAHRGPHRRQTRPILGQMRLADLDLGPGEALRLDRERILDERGRLDMQPAALGRIKRDRRFRPARHPPQRQLRAAAAQVPQRRVDGGERDGGDRPHRRRMGDKQKITPDRLDLLCLTAKKAWRQRIAQQADDAGTASADGIAVAGAHRAIGIGDPHHRRFLRHEGLDRVGPLHQRHQRHHQDFDMRDARHQTTLTERPLSASNRCARSSAMRKVSRSPG